MRLTSLKRAAASMGEASVPAAQRDRRRAWPSAGGDRPGRFVHWPSIMPPPHQRRRGRPGGRKGRPGVGSAARAGAPVPPLGPPGRTVPRALLLATGAIAAFALIGVVLFVVVRGSGSTTATCAPDSNGWDGAGGGPPQTGPAAATIHAPNQGRQPSCAHP